MTHLSDISPADATFWRTALIEQLRTELLPFVDQFQDAGTRGLFNLKNLPYKGMQWDYRAYQRDPFVIAFTDVVPRVFGTFTRRDDLISHRRLVFHSDIFDLDLTLRRRGSFGAFKPARSSEQVGVQEELFEGPPPPTGTRLAALIWDTPDLSKKSKSTGPIPLAVKVAKEGRLLDDNDWEGGFLMSTNGDELIPGRTEYRPDVLDWDVESESDAQ